MTKVRFFELNRDKRLDRLEKKINKELETQGCGKTCIRLFRDSDGVMGYSAQIYATSWGKKILDRIHRIVSRMLGYKRGRPPAEPTRQVKCRVPESVYQHLVREAKKRKVSPSKLVREWVMKRVG